MRERGGRETTEDTGNEEFGVIIITFWGKDGLLRLLDHFCGGGGKGEVFLGNVGDDVGIRNEIDMGRTRRRASLVQLI
jgi:hypothetical protein